MKESEKLPLETVFLLQDKAECQNKPKKTNGFQAAKMRERDKKPGTNIQHYGIDLVHGHTKCIELE